MSQSQLLEKPKPRLPIAKPFLEVVLMLGKRKKALEFTAEQAQGIKFARTSRFTPFCYSNMKDQVGIERHLRHHTCHHLALHGIPEPWDCVEDRSRQILRYPWGEIQTNTIFAEGVVGSITYTCFLPFYPDAMTLEKQRLL